MVDKSVQVVNKPEFLEVSEGEFSTTIQIELSPASPVLSKTPTMKRHLRMTPRIFNTKLIH